MRAKTSPLWNSSVVIAGIVICLLLFYLDKHKIYSAPTVSLEASLGSEDLAPCAVHLALPSWITGRSTEVPGRKIDSSQVINSSALWKQPLLPLSSLQRGVVSFGDPARLRRVVHRLATGKHVSIVGLGSSITVGAGGDAVLANGTITGPWPGYLYQFGRWIREAFPAANASLVNAAVSATHQSVFSACLHTMVPETVDLLVAEVGLSQHFCDPHYAAVPAVERIIRAALQYPKQPAIILMQAYGWEQSSNGVQGNQGSFYDNIENVLNVQASYYGLPVVSVRSGMWHLMAQNRTGFKVGSRVFDHPELVDELFYFDGIHPNGRTGHRYMSEMLQFLIQTTVVGLHIQPWAGEGEEAPAGSAVPPPIISGNWEKKASVCNLKKDFEKFVVEASSFSWVNEHPDAPNSAAEKWGWVALHPGSYADILVDTVINGAASTGSDALNTSDKESIVLLGHMKSYEHMGQARVECIANCTCEPTIFNSLWETKASVMDLHSFKVKEHPWCRIRVTVLDATSNPTGEHKIKLSGIIVVPSGTWVVEGSKYFYTEQTSLAV